MTTYNTGNPVPSGNAKDRFDNSQTFDEVINGALTHYKNRIGNNVLSLKGMADLFNAAQSDRAEKFELMESEFDAAQEQRKDEFNQLLINTQFEMPPIPYQEGGPIEVSRPTQLISHEGQLYSVKLPASFPFQLSGIWDVAVVSLKPRSDEALRQQLAAITGAELVGYIDRNVSDWLTQQAYWRTIEYYGPTDTPINTKNTMQKAVNETAAAGLVLINGSPSYTIDTSVSGIAIPDNFRCLFYAWINRATGNKTPHDMWANADPINGNSGLDIRGVRFNGNAQLDGLANANPAHRFCGLRLIKCQGKLADVRADATCNGEIQDEGIRGGIMLEDSVFMDCETLRADRTLGTGLFIRGGKGRLFNFQSNDNTGSGMSGDQPGWIMGALSSIGSGYSGISLNGPGFIVNGVYGARAAVGYAGVNFGHATPSSSHGVDVIATNVVAEDNAGWGINATSCPGITGTGWVSKRSGVDNVRLLNSPGAKISLVSRDAARHGLLVDGAGTCEVTVEVTGCAANGVYGRNGADIGVSAESVITGNGGSGGLVAGVTLDTAAKVRVRGRVLVNKAYGVQSTGGSTVTLDGGTVSGNVSGNVRQADGGIVRYEKAKFSNDAMSGTLTILSGTNSASIENGNVIDISQIVFQPANAAARTAGLPYVSTYQPGVSFTAQIAANAPANAIYRFNLL